jgi:hypothetical protein
MKIYCEHGALSSYLKTLRSEGKIELIHFPYDPESRTRHIAPAAMPSEAQWQDMNMTFDELDITFNDFKGSEHLLEICRIIGAGNRRDILHVDSAYKTGCQVMVTADRDILDHKTELEALLGLRIVHPENDEAELKVFISSALGN